MTNHPKDDDYMLWTKPMDILLHFLVRGYGNDE